MEEGLQANSRGLLARRTGFRRIVGGFWHGRPSDGRNINGRCGGLN